MSQGTIAAICIGPERGGPMQRVETINAIEGRGIEGDRYFDAPPKPDPGTSLDITLVAKEGVEQAAEESGLDLEPEDTRRNLVTEGIDLRGLIGSRFRVGEVELEAVREAAPCKRLEKITGKPLRKPLAGRAGIRARIITSGTIRVGDLIRKEG